MRALLGTASVCLLLALSAGGIAAAPPPATAPATAAPPSTSAPGGDGEAAAKHAKRTACLKSAKAKKLVDAQKTAFIKECMAAP
jgi:hypothetical protein